MNPWDNDPVVDTAPATAAPANATQPWKSDPAVSTPEKPWAADPVVAQAPPATPSPQGTTAGLPTWASLAHGEIEQQERGHKLLETIPGQYEMLQTHQPRKLSLSEKTAIMDAYRKNYEFMPDTRQQTEAGQAGLQTNAQIQQASVAGNSALQNFSGAAAQGLASAGTGLLGAVAPGAANSLQQDVNQNYQFDPDSKAGFAGGVVGATLPMVPAMVNPTNAFLQTMTAGGMGASVAGQVRQDVAQRRAAGEEISHADELKAAGLTALTTFLAGKAGMNYAGKAIGSMTGGVAKYIANYAANVGIQATDQMLMHVANGVIKRAYVDPNVNPEAGAAEAALTGAAMGAITSPIAAHLAHGNKAEAPAAKTPEAPDIKGVLQNPEAVKQTLAEEQAPEQEAKPTPKEEPKLPANLDTHQPKYRVQDENGNSKGVPLTFDSAVDKALYLASQPRKGKISKNAAEWLEAQGIKPEEQAKRAEEVRDHVEAHGEMYSEGETIPVPALEEKAQAPAEKEAPVEQPKAEAEAPAEPAFSPAKSTPEPFVSTKSHQEVLDEAVPGAKHAEIPKHFSDVVDAAGKVGRTEVVGYSGGKGRGFFHEGRLFLNVDNPQNATPEGKREVAMHEASHAAQQTNPDLLEKLAEAAPQSIKDQVAKEYGRLYARQEGKAPDQAVLDRETVPMVVGKLMRSGRAFNEVFQENRGLLARGVDAVLASVRSLTEKGRYQNQILASLKELKAQADHSPVESREEAASFLPEHSPKIRDEAEEYTKQAGLPYEPDTSYAPVNEERAGRIADWYDKAKHEPNSPEVKKSYDAFKKETLDQWNYLNDKGVKMEAWDQKGQPYADSKGMTADVRNNRHLYFYTGGDLPQDHPLSENAPGTPYTYNDVFRAVHDYFGHAKEGIGFGPRGEENAWRSHSQMYSEDAKPAMSTETRGQNSWVNFGPHGESNRANPKETKYAEQKATAMPAEWTKAEPGPKFLPDYKPKGKEQKEALEKIQEHLTAKEYNALSTNDAKRAVDMYRSLPPSSEFITAARAGEAMKGWYERSAETLKKTFGKDTEKFVDLLAATSPRQSVVNNLREATRIWAAWTKAGRPSDPEEIRKLIETGGATDLFGNTSSLSGLKNRIPNAIRALTGEALSGPKVTGFAENLQGNYKHTTNDTWMATFGGVDQKEFANQGGYLGYTAKLRDVAKQMGWTPANVQETVWSTMKSLAEKVSGGKTGIEALKSLRHEDIATTPNFENLMGDPDVTRELQRAGLQPAKAGTSTPGFSGPILSDITPEHRAIVERAERWATAKGRSVGAEDFAQNQFESNYAGKEEDQPLPEKPNDDIPFLPGSQAAKQFWNDDVKESAVKTGEALKGVWNGIKSIWAPQTRTHQGLMASETWRTRNAELAQRMDRLDAAFSDARGFLDKAPKAVTRNMIDEMERGQKQSQPHLQPIADALRSVFDDRLHEVQALGTGKLQNFVENYFPHIWTDPKKAANLYAEIASKTPLQGKRAFLKARSLPYLSDGLARGLEPVTENPVEAMMLRVREMDKYITATKAMEEMNNNGLLRTIKARDPVPAGYAKINDSVATLFAAPSRRGALQIAGYKVAPEAVANVINNQLSPGLRGDKYFGGVFRGFLGAGNLMNSAQLGLSGFHLTMTAMDSATSQMSLALRNVGEGNIGAAAKNLGLAFTGVGPAIRNVSQGSRLMKEWFHPGSTDPETARLAYWMKQAGGRAKMDDFYHTGLPEKMMEAFRKGNYIGAAIRAPFAAIEAAAKPLMEKIVPRMKMGVFMDMARFELERLGPNAPENEVRRAMTKAWDSVDNRMGQLVYDNLFWHKAAKDLAMASTRSVGWNLGTLRELGGGALDFGKAGVNLVRGRNAEFTHRMAYTAAMPIMAGLIGGVIHYMNMGQVPQEMKDWFFPKSGQKDQDDHDVRYALPSYMKDVYAYAKNPGETVKNKVHPLVHTVLDMLSNRDYYGDKISNEDDPFMQKLADKGKYLGKQFLPFSTREVPKLLSEGQGAKALLPLVGVTKARKDISYTPAELQAAEIHQNAAKGSRTTEQVERSNAVREYAAGFRNKTPGTGEAVNQALREGKLTPSDIDAIKERVRFTGLAGSIHSMPMHDAMLVWEKANEAERLKLGPTMFQKLRATKAITREQKVGYLQTLQRDWAAVKISGKPAGVASNDQE